MDLHDDGKMKFWQDSNISRMKLKHVDNIFLS
jgi:hypothetical protein